LTGCRYTIADWIRVTTSPGQVVHAPVSRSPDSITQYWQKLRSRWQVQPCV